MTATSPPTPNGNIFFSTQAALDIKIREILRVVDEIQTHSTPTIQRCYARFLEENNHPDDREYSDDADQIREVLIHAHYLSQKEIEPPRKSIFLAIAA